MVSVEIFPGTDSPGFQTLPPQSPCFMGVDSCGHHSVAQICQSVQISRLESLFQPTLPRCIYAAARLLCFQPSPGTLQPSLLRVIFVHGEVPYLEGQFLPHTLRRHKSADDESTDIIHYRFRSKAPSNHRQRSINPLRGFTLQQHWHNVCLWVAGNDAGIAITLDRAPTAISSQKCANSVRATTIGKPVDKFRFYGPTCLYYDIPR